MKPPKLSDKEIEELGRLEAEVKAELQSLAELNREEKEHKLGNVQSMIEYYHSMSEYIESKRNGIYNFALQFLAICAAAIGLLLYLKELPCIVLWMLMSVLIVFSLFSLLIIFVHELQSKFTYPFNYMERLKKYGNKWKWFYYSSEQVPRISRRPVFPSRKFHNTVKPYMEGLRAFIHNYSEEDIDRQLSDDIQQLYVLQVLNYYKNRFFLQLTQLRMWSVYVTIFALIVILLYHYSL